MFKIHKNILKQAILFFSTSLVGNLLNLLYNFYLGKTLSTINYTSIALFLSGYYAFNIIFNALSTTLSYFIGLAPSKSKQFIVPIAYSILNKYIFIISVTISILWVFLIPSISYIWKATPSILLFFIPILVFGLYSHVNRGILQGLLHFSESGKIFLFESISKIVIAFILLLLGFYKYVFVSIPLSVILSYICSLWFIKVISNKNNNYSKNEYPRPKIFSLSYFVFSSLLGFSTLTFLSLDIILAKAYFTAEIVGAYALITLSGKILFLFSSLLNSMLISTVSNSIGENKNTKNIFNIFFSITLLFVIIGSTFFITFGKSIFLIMFGDKVIQIISILPVYILAIALFTLVNVLVTYHHAQRKYIFSIIASLSSILLIMGSFLAHSTIDNLINLFFLVALFEFLVIFLLHLYSGHFTADKVHKG